MGVAASRRRSIPGSAARRSPSRSGLDLGFGGRHRAVYGAFGPVPYHDGLRGWLACSTSGAPGAPGAGLPWRAGLPSRWPVWASPYTWPPSAPTTSPIPTPPFNKQQPPRSRRWTGRSTVTTSQRTRYLPSKDLNPPFRSSEWSFQAGKLLEFQPIVVKDRIYFMDKDGTFYALSTDKGRVEWKRKIGSLNASAPAYRRRSAVRGQPGAEPGGGASPERARQQGAVAPAAARAQRVLAARPRRQGDLRL